ncbi:phage tail protein [uncultured Pseudomonas sp.]|uniref:phage tail protein n=1 Tax=uncultured Pseudomonas sp. TaxID=114707 RepID=UPI00258A3A0D|nr:phage tail protein [uncultured Pseudomonas sp.]
MSQTYYAILTAIGEAKLANAAALNTTLKIAKMAVGDGGGVVPTPSRSQTALVGEWYRAGLNTLAVDPSNTSQIIAELVIPEATGGNWIREMGLIDADGNLIAVANTPPSYKPQLAEGSGRTQVLRMVLVVSSTSAVELKIDPAVILATRQYVDEAITVAINTLDSKQSVRVATVGAITLSGTQTVDGIALVAGDRVLVKDQAAGAANGIYVVAAGAWPRAADANASLEVTPGMLVPVEVGNANGDSLWQLVTDGAISLGETALAFEMVGGIVGAAGTYRSVTVDRRGRVIGGTNPTTIAGYGIVDGPQAYGIGRHVDWREVNGVSITGAPSSFYGRGTAHGFANGATDGNRALAIPALGTGTVYGALTVHAQWADDSGLSTVIREFRTGTRIFISAAASATTWSSWVEVFTSGNPEGLPYAALPFPTVGTDDGRIAVTATAVSGNGGRVSIPSGIKIALGEELPGSTARVRTLSTPAWNSDALAENKTYFLRANIQNGALTPYISTGSDTDSAPQSLKTQAGQPAGYDSTVLDVLLAKVVTGAAGSAPTVIALANKAKLEAAAYWVGASGSYSLTLNWARSPKATVASFADYDNNSKSDYTIAADNTGPDSIPTGGYSDRYAGRVYIAAYIPTGNPGPGKINARVRWEA